MSGGWRAFLLLGVAVLAFVLLLVGTPDPVVG